MSFATPISSALLKEAPSEDSAWLVSKLRRNIGPAGMSKVSGPEGVGRIVALHWHCISLGEYSGVHELALKAIPRSVKVGKVRNSLLAID